TTTASFNGFFEVGVGGTFQKSEAEKGTRLTWAPPVELPGPNLNEAHHRPGVDPMDTEHRALMNKTQNLIDETTTHELAELRGVIQSTQETIVNRKGFCRALKLQRRAMASSGSIRA